jgi:hypothetical protein
VRTVPMRRILPFSPVTVIAFGSKNHEGLSALAPMDRLTDGELMSAARKYFKRVDRMIPQPQDP